MREGSIMRKKIKGAVRRRKDSKKDCLLSFFSPQSGEFLGKLKIQVGKLKFT